MSELFEAWRPTGESEQAIARNRNASIGPAMAALLRRLQAGDVTCDSCKAGWAVTVVRAQGTIRGLCSRCSCKAAHARSLRSNRS